MGPRIAIISQWLSAAAAASASVTETHSQLPLPSPVAHVHLAPMRALTMGASENSNAIIASVAEIMNVCFGRDRLVLSKK